MKKKLFSRLTVAMLTLCMLAALTSATLVGCGKDPQPEEAVVESITLDTSAVKTTYEWGEQFTTNGLKVIANKSDKTTEEIPVNKCAVTKPDFTSPGEKEVRVMYQGVRATYKVTLKEREIPKVSETPLFEVKGEKPNASYKVEMESVDLNATKVQAAGGKNLIVDDANVSGGKYLANYGVKENYIGFTFTTEYAYENVTLVMHMSNPYKEVLSVGESFNLYMNYKGFSDTGAIDISAMPTLPGVEVITPTEPEAKDETPTEPETKLVWQSKVIRNLSLPKGTNTLSLDVKSETVPNIDYIEFYVGKPYGANSLLEITEKTTYVKEFEDFDLEKIIVRADIKAAHGLKDGQAFVETANTNIEGTSGGKSCGATMAGSEVSTVIRAAADVKVKIEIACASVDNYLVKDNWAFELDGVKLEEVEELNIKDGNASLGQYWQWHWTRVGIVELTEGDHMFVVKVTGKDCNVDCLKFTVIGDTTLPEGAHTCAHVCAHCGKCLDPDCDYTACADKCTTHHCEDVCPDCGKCMTSCDKGDECVEKCKCPHRCNHKCVICGKCTSDCTNNSENGSECVEKCDCPEYDVAVHKLGSVIKEAETLDNSGVVTRQDFINAGLVGEGEYRIGGGEGASGGQSIHAFTTGTVFTFTVYVVKEAKVSVSLTAACGDGTYLVKNNLAFKIDNETLVYEGDGDIHGSTNNGWKTVTVAQDVVLTAGMHTFSMEVKGSHFDLDCFTVTATEYDGQVPHECAHVCEDCGKCTDADCTDPACADKCEGHQPEAHVCGHVCPETDCGKCTDPDCTDPFCADKCTGHEPTEA
ncbi:MAG: carbohydrate-binding protein [Clostridia bacterium]|nr:carbohydrate-binding protein [Clostridia bacterium]